MWNPEKKVEARGRRIDLITEKIKGEEHGVVRQQ